ncbi:hypothetical protein PO909_012462 [Leuciscus waleckii]
MLLFEHKQHLQSYNAQSLKQRKIFSFFKDYNKRLVGTTRHSSWVSDITNPNTLTPPPETHTVQVPTRAIYRLS